jgi:very-short-patch-repair endonuclease
LVDAEIAALATRQHGVVARAQLTELGLGRRAIGHRLDRGRLIPLHRGVYAVGHRSLSLEGRWLAAVLAIGGDAVLSHRSAAALWALRPTSRSRVEVTAPRALRSRPAIQLHREAVAGDEATVEDAIPVTSVPRTLVDLAGLLRPAELRRAVEQAETLRRVDALSLDAVVQRHRGRAGIARLAAIVEAGVDAPVTRSELERRFLSFLEEAGLPRPRTNRRLAAGDRDFEVDCVWPAARVVVELDGALHHSTRAAFERDRDRDRALLAAGWRVVRVTWRQLDRQAAAVAADLWRLL